VTNAPGYDDDSAGLVAGRLEDRVGALLRRRRRDLRHERRRQRADGTSRTSPANDGDPTWSPDGAKIAFTTNRGRPGDNEIFVMNADGSNPVDLTNSPANESDPDWQPVPGPTPAAPGPSRMCKVPEPARPEALPARTKARKAGCAAGTVKYARSKKPRGRVVRQAPRKGLRLCFGVPVNVVISRGLR
jgi:hypothetical protein